MLDVLFPRKSALESCQVDFGLINYRLYRSEDSAGAYPTGENMSRTYNKVFSFDALFLRKSNFNHDLGITVWIKPKYKCLLWQLKSHILMWFNTLKRSVQVIPWLKMKPTSLKICQVQANLANLIFPTFFYVSTRESIYENYLFLVCGS